MDSHSFFNAFLAWTRTVAQTLTVSFGQIADIAAQKYHIYPTARECGSRLSHHAEFSIKEQTQPSSYAGAAVIPRKNGQLGILIWHPLTQIQSRIVRQRWFFLLADLIGLLLLFLFFQYFITRMLQPLMENREKQMQFIAAASHELRSPITVILSNLTACRSGLIPNDNSFLTLLDTEGNRMARLVNDMLQLANADRPQLEHAPCRGRAGYLSAGSLRIL